MDRRTEATNSEHTCVVCGASDKRMLTTVELTGGTATLCGSHALLYKHLETPARTLGELRHALEERRETSRRREVGDELGERLIAAFTSDRRTAERRI